MLVGLVASARRRQRLTLRHRPSRLRRRIRRHQPRPKIARPVPARKALERSSKRFLNHVLGIMHVTNHAVAEPKDRALKTLHELIHGHAVLPASTVSTVRDFVGLAENAWDFNDPHAMPGFGPLDCSEEQLGALVDRIVGGVRGAADSLTTAIPEQKDASQSADSDHEPLLESRASEAVADQSPAEESSMGEPSATSAAVQPETPHSDGSDQTSTRRRIHGSALPR